MRTIVQPEAADKQCANLWFAEAEAMGQPDVNASARPCYLWPASLDVHVHPERRRPRTFLATGVNISKNGLAFVCREALPLYSRITICSAGAPDGVKAKIVDRKQAVNGHVIHAEFEFEPPRRAAVVSAA